MSTTRAAAGRRSGAHAVHHRAHAEALVEVGAAEEHQQVLVAGAHRPDLAGVPGHGRRREPGQVGGAELGGGLAERVDGGQPAGAHHQGDVVALDPGLLGEHGGGLGGGVAGRGGLGAHAAHPSRGVRRRASADRSSGRAAARSAAT